jgi:hypothetical protein
MYQARQTPDAGRRTRDPEIQRPEERSRSREMTRETERATATDERYLGIVVKGVVICYLIHAQGGCLSLPNVCTVCMYHRRGHAMSDAMR